MASKSLLAAAGLVAMAAASSVPVVFQKRWDTSLCASNPGVAIPDSDTFQLPLEGYRSDMCWDLCLGDQTTCDVTSQVCYDFSGENLVFNFGSVSGYTYTEADVCLGLTAPDGSASQYTTGNGACALSADASTASCTIPYSSIITSGDVLSGMCPNGDSAGLTFYLNTNAVLTDSYGSSVNAEGRLACADYPTCSVQLPETYWELSYRCTNCPAASSSSSVASSTPTSSSSTPASGVTTSSEPCESSSTPSPSPSSSNPASSSSTPCTTSTPTSSPSSSAPSSSPCSSSKPASSTPCTTSKPTSSSSSSTPSSSPCSSSKPASSTPCTTSKPTSSSSSSKPSSSPCSTSKPASSTPCTTSKPTSSSSSSKPASSTPCTTSKPASSSTSSSSARASSTPCTKTSSAMPSPSTIKYCNYGTAFGHHSSCSNEFQSLSSRPSSCNRWGWFETFTSRQMSSGLNGPLYVGAGGNDLSQAINVGSWTAWTASDGKIYVDCCLSNGYSIGTLSVDVGCSNINSCNPDNFGYNYSPAAGTSSLLTSGFAMPNCGRAGTPYIIVQAAVNTITTIPASQAGSYTCPKPVCQ